MGFLSKLFSGPKPITKIVDVLGELEFFNDGTDRYWQIKNPLPNLPNEFTFGSIAGDVNMIDSGAAECFKAVSKNPATVYSLLDDAFYSKANEHLSNVDSDNVDKEFYLYSLTTSDRNNYEFGLHSRSKDIFIELFVRNGGVTEVHLDEGCCEV